MSYPIKVKKTCMCLPPPMHGTTGTLHYGKSQKSQLFEKYQSSQDKLLITRIPQAWQIGPSFQTVELWWMLPGQHRQSKLQLPIMSSFLNKLACISCFCSFHSPHGCDSMSLSCMQAAASWFSPISRHILKQRAIMLCFSLSPGRQRLM